MYLTAQNILDLECIFQLCEVYLQPKNLQFALGEKKEARIDDGSAGSIPR